MTISFSFILLLLMAAFYIYAGVSHFRHPKFFLRIMPPYIPSPEKVNLLVGAIEVILGVMLLIPATTSLAAWGVIALLIAVFPANIYHHQKARAKGKHVTATLIRLPIQALLVFWAYCYT
ncbi:MAG: DoxX family protein [Chitinophagales bacterium]